MTRALPWLHIICAGGLEVGRVPVMLKLHFYNHSDFHHSNLTEGLLAKMSGRYNDLDSRRYGLRASRSCLVVYTLRVPIVITPIVVEDTDGARGDKTER